MEDKHLFDHHLQAYGKLDYAKGKKPNVPCILCAIRDNNPNITSLKVYEDAVCFICLNLYPYNPGHVMVIPKQHILKFEDLSESDRHHIFDVVITCQRMLQKLFNPTGFNSGYNQGEYSGASIDHIHFHVVPRYKGELGYIDIIGQTRVVVQDVMAVKKQIDAVIKDYFP